MSSVPTLTTSESVAISVPALSLHAKLRTLRAKILIGNDAQAIHKALDDADAALDDLIDAIDSISTPG